ncbi:sugar ABC transporter permease [Leifsonia shinshuensis]|uniref:carbohydrate ABC transporter permease n=1 Tax=Leifsonia shinshuensis TaxID=150026 RepID=UPI001F510D31|nr:sugar ABC transporter permease [Leifsonia shinshuensis]MCI0157552.1 sugar ABC transporter permease [Leifsonia shinshuensis]
MSTKTQTTTSGATTAPVASPRRAPRTKPYRVKLGSWWWALPALVLMLIVIYATTIAGGFFAFTNWSGLGAFDFVGLQNFVKIFQTPELIGSLWNTLILAFGFLVFTNIFGLLFALALNRTLKSRYVLRTLIFMPVVVSPIAVSYIWKFIFDYNGPLNQAMTAVGLPKQNWLASPALAIWCVLIVMVWQNIGFVMVIYLAGLATVPIEMEEAAALDGASTFKRFRYVVLPQIQPSVAIATTLTLIQGLRVFDQVVALTGGGPAGATQTLALEVYQTAFTYQQFGFGAALALILSLLILVFSLAQQYATRDRSLKEA